MLISIRLELSASTCKLKLRGSRMRSVMHSYADPEFESVPTAELLSPSFADSLREKINLNRASGAEPTLPIVTQRDTVCLTVVDGAGNACSLVNSLFDAFGCGKVCPRTAA